MIALIEDGKAEVQVDRLDVMSMDATMSMLLLPLMQTFRKYNQGFPVALGAADDPDGEAKWYAVLDEIIWAMDVTAKGTHYDWGLSDMALHERRQAAFESFGKNFTNLWV